MTSSIPQQADKYHRADAALIVAALSGLLFVGFYLAIWGRRYDLDLRVYRDASLAWQHGRDPYLSTFSRYGLNFTYPPIALAFFVPSTLASLQITQFAFWTISIGSTTCAVAFVLRDGGMALTRRTWGIAFVWTCVSLIALEPARSGLDYGQIESVLMFFVVSDLLVVPKRFRGIAIAVSSAVKLTPLVFIFALLTYRDLKAAIRALVAFAGLTALSWLVWPGFSATYWRKDVVNVGRVGQVAYLGDQSLMGILHRAPFVGSPVEALWLGMSLVTVAASVFVAWRCARAGRRALAMIAVALGGTLVSPISWSHHWVWVVLIPPVLLLTRNAGVSRAVQAMLWGIVAIAALGPYWWISSGWLSDVFGALLPTWTMALLFFWAVTEMRRPLPEVDDSLSHLMETV